GNFGINASRFLAFGIVEHECNVTISFNFYANEAASEVIPFLFICDSRIRLWRQRLIRFLRFPLVNLRLRGLLNCRLVKRQCLWIDFIWTVTTVYLVMY